ncbi:hypothetical protein DF107_24280 [Burkholderia stagnalis]|nr:hypothetical protein DF164_30140 [Burkholderia stagnalis]RQQ12884.1 hypothetical protein DF161_21655 [Burkholderia stagnalis]RQQ26526.1 hypothetical protein DF148_29470 [Burkholderia stagnalis]RQQ94963.1 hypothetical protein DF031_28975 [Burkholderia stagnalis]RQX88652.1 hypothetical protein DF120_24145 [Burkholderia stagnalis]
MLGDLPDAPAARSGLDAGRRVSAGRMKRRRPAMCRGAALAARGPRRALVDHFVTPDFRLRFLMATGRCRRPAGQTATGPVRPDAALLRLVPGSNPVGDAGFDPGVIDVWIGRTSCRRLPRVIFRKERAIPGRIQLAQGVRVGVRAK